MDIADTINELVYELSECREDERNSKDQMLQVISTAGAIIGVCFGLSALFPNSEYSQEIPETVNHLVLFLTSCVLCTAFPYITFLGIGNVLRFHYIRGLEDKLSQLVSEHNGQKFVLHWMSMSAPIMTKNLLHIKNTKYTVASYFCYALATVSAISFGFVTIIIEFKNIIDPKWYDYVSSAIALTAILLSFATFVLISFKAKDMYDKSYDIATKDRNNRLSNSEKPKPLIKEKLTEIFQVILYYVYPKGKDFQKLLLIPLGVITGIFLVNGTISFELVITQMTNILITVFVIDILIYQSRYQWNDICGMDEDQKAGKTDRLPIHILGKPRAVILSVTLILLKITFAILLCLARHYDFLLMFAILIGVIAVLYEFSRQRQYNKLIYIIVGLGYPLRFFSGLWSVWCDKQVSNISWYLVFALLMAYMAFGCFSVLLSWTHEAISEETSGMQKFTKSYHVSLYNVVKDRDNGSHTPLNEAGKIMDPWNLAYTASIGILTLYAMVFLFVYSSPVLLFVEGVCGIIIISVYRKPIGHVLINAIFAIGFIVGKGILSIYFLGWFPEYICVCVHQLFFMVIYCFLKFCFAPNYNFFNIFRSFRNHRKKT